MLLHVAAMLSAEETKQRYIQINQIWIAIKEARKEFRQELMTCRNHTFPNEVHNQGLGSTRPQVKCCPGSDDAPSWEMFDFHMGMDSCFYPMTCKKHQGSHVEIAHFCIRLFCMNCAQRHGLMSVEISEQTAVWGVFWSIKKTCGRPYVYFSHAPSAHRERVPRSRSTCTHEWLHSSSYSIKVWKSTFYTAKKQSLSVTSRTKS